MRWCPCSVLPIFYSFLKEKLLVAGWVWVRVGGWVKSAKPSGIALYSEEENLALYSGEETLDPTRSASKKK